MSLQAMMTLNLCLESYGAAVHVMDSLLGVSAEQARRPLRQVRLARSSVRYSSPGAKQITPQLDDAEAESFTRQVRAAAESMPFEQAHALWLVDVCRCSYDQAAAEVAVSRDELAGRVAGGRSFIRARMVGTQAATPVG